MWNGILKILTFQVIRNDEIIYKEENLNNILHTNGEAFCLSILFNSATVPANYYAGLDNRSTLASADTMASLIQEPTTFGYARQSLPPTAFGFTIELAAPAIYRAKSSVVTFNAVGGSWGPVRNIFLTDSITLISSASLGSPVILTAGDSINMRISMQLKDCP